MRSTCDLDTFLTAPVGSQFVAAHFTYWYPCVGTTGFAMWGSPDQSDIRLLHHVMDAMLRRNEGSRVSLVDMSRLGTVDPMVFRTMAEYVATRWHEFGVTRQACVRPPGLSGAVVAGFYEVVTPNYPVQVFTAVEPALTWLGLERDAGLRSAVSAARTDEGVDPVLGRLRILLQSECEQACDLPTLARRMGLSRRTLQRRLASCGTTLQREARIARLQAAQSLMLAGSLSLTRIALELGFASLQHFSALFRKHYGQSPTEWLRRRSDRQPPTAHERT